MDEIKIEKGIPMPEPRVWGITEALRKMDVGDSIFLRGKKSNNITTIVAHLTKKTERKFVTRTVDGGVRVLEDQMILTPREQTLIPLLIQGMTDKEIARELGLLDSSVRTYVVTLRKKFGVNNRTKLALKLIQIKEAANSFS